MGMSPTFGQALSDSVWVKTFENTQRVAIAVIVPQFALQFKPARPTPGPVTTARYGVNARRLRHMRQ